MNTLEISFPLSIDQIITFVSQEKYSFFLDSSDQNHKKSHYSYFGFNPSQILEGDDFNQFDFSLLDDIHDKADIQNFFIEGWFGYIHYDCHRLQKQRIKNGIWFGYYDFVLVINHKSDQCFLSSFHLNQNELKKRESELKRKLDFLKGKKSEEVEIYDIQEIDYQTYQLGFDRIQSYLESGDVYQINYTVPFQCKTNISPEKIYKKIRSLSPVPYGCFFNFGTRLIISATPECLFEKKGQDIFTYPIKGTIARKADFDQDRKAQEILKQSRKDRAELLMIVDLERNDFGKICQTGSVKVIENFQIESFAHVHHMVAKIYGLLKEKMSFKDIFEAIFPGGSVTGAPKKRAMEIISEIEKRDRGIYTGAIGFVGVGKYSLFNLPIRTIEFENGMIGFQAGGGIVIDSECRSEYLELKQKVKAFLMLGEQEGE